MMRVSDKTKPLHHPILKPANLPDFLAGARKGERVPQRVAALKWEFSACAA
jgi:hypothetical protein